MTKAMVELTVSYMVNMAIMQEVTVQSCFKSNKMNNLPNSCSLRVVIMKEVMKCLHPYGLAKIILSNPEVCKALFVKLVHKMKSKPTMYSH